MKREKIQIKGTNKNPKIVFDLKSGIIKILGRSTMCSPQEFYPSIISLLKEYCSCPEKKTTLIIDLEYYNTLSTRYLLKIVDVVTKIELKDNCSVKINWFFDPDDIGIEDDIKLFSELIQFKINAISYELA